jgi:hypothetical protein
MRSHLRWTLVVALFGLVAPTLSYAQDEEEPGKDAAGEGDEEEQAQKHFAAGRKLYDEAKYKEAIAELLKAYNLRPAPPILLNIARTYEKLGEKKNALKFYKEFLLKARMVDPSRPQVQAVVKELEKQVSGKTSAVTSGDGTDTPTAHRTGDEGDTVPKGKLQMIHTPVDSAKVHEAITIMAELPPRLAVDRVVLFVRKAGEIQFQPLPMELAGETYVARIPASFVTSTSLQYYIEAQKGTGKGSIVASAAGRSTPNIIVVEGGLAPVMGPVKEDTIRSPYWKWMWVSASATAAFFAVGGLGIGLMVDRKNAMERWVHQQSCKDGSPCADPNNKAAVPTQPFDVKARDWESEGKTYAALGQAFLVLGGVAAVATGAMVYLDRRWVKQERAKRPRRGNAQRFLATPWMSPSGAGVLGRIDF